jgi:hypothetical protein
LYSTSKRIKLNKKGYDRSGKYWGHYGDDTEYGLFLYQVFIRCNNTDYKTFIGRAKHRYEAYDHAINFFLLNKDDVAPLFKWRDPHRLAPHELYLLDPYLKPS